MKSSTKRLRLFMIALFTCIACVCLVFGVTACSGSKSSGAIKLDKTSVTIAVGETDMITATATNDDGGAYTGNYVWTYDGDAIEIMTEGNTCMIKGISAGQASITVTAGSYSVRCDVTVFASSTTTGTTSVETVSIEPDELKLYTGQSGTVAASLTVTGGTTYTGGYEWESSNIEVATVTKGENGSCTITAIGAGTATITVTVGAEGAKKQATCKVTVAEDTIATLELSEEAIVVAKEGTSTLIVTVKMTSGASSTDFKAEIEDDSIATIAVSGNTITVTGVEAGDTKITVTAGNITKECTVTVKEPEIAEIALSKTSVTLGTNETAEVGVTVRLDNGKATDDYTASVSCEPENIVTAEVTNGVLTITASGTEGSVKITVTIDGTTISTDCNVIVADVQKEYYFDFSNAETYGWLVEGLTPTDNGEGGEMYTLATGTSYITGIVTYTTHSSGNNTINSENAGALFTAGTSSNFAIDLSAFEGLYVSITVKMSTNGNDGDNRTLYVNNNKSTSSGLKSITSSGKTNYQTLEYGEVISAGETLYLTWSANIRIFTVEIEIKDAGDVTPEVRDVTLDKTSLSLYVEETDYLTATVEMTIGDFAGTYEWASSNEAVARVEGSENGATVIAVSEGTATITVTAGGKSAECVVTVSAVDESVIESVYVDFGDSSTYTWIGSTITSGETYSDPLGILTLHAGGSTAITSDHLNTGGSSSSGNNRYFSIDLSSYVTDVVSIEVVMTSNSSENRSVCLDTQYANAGSTESNTTLAFATSSSTSDKQKLEYMAEITDANKTLYLTCDKSVNYYTIDIKILDPSAMTPEVQGVTLSDSVLILEAGGTGSLTATVKMNIGEYDGEYEWTSSDGGVVTVNGTSATPTITAVGAGTATITVFVGGYSAECLVVVSAEGEEADYEWIYNDFDYTKAYSDNGTTAITESYTQGIFTVDKDAVFETEDFNTQKADVTIVLSGITNNISFTAKGGSGSGNSVVKLYLVNEDDSRKDVTPSDWPVDGIAQNVSGDFTASGLVGGTYVITTSLTARIYSLKVEQFVAVSDPVGISATAGTVDFLKGRDVSVDDLKLNIMLDYENGRQDPLDVSNVTVSLVSSNLSVGRNEITITYYYTYEDENNASNTKEFTTSVYIYVYSIDYITISDFSMEKSSSTYITHNVQKVFLVGDEVNYDYAAVTASATCTYTDGDGNTVTLTNDFIMTEADGLVFSNNANMSIAATYQVTATANMGETEGNSKAASYDIHVVDATGADITTVNVVHPTENDDGTETEVATYAADSDGIISVSTINDAIMLIKLMGATDAERKYIYVGEGQYWEKVYIDIPNLSLIGSNSSETADLATRQETTEIVYWAYNGLMDPSGTTTFSTVGSATVTVASTATDFYAANITFRNYWNTNALFNECKTYTSDTQADAAYINADRAHFYNVTFTGYHDTLEAENGRQYYDHCYIEGRTDYIFGDTATCYFKDCTIHTIGADSTSNGGYVTAVKGGSMTYGYVFDGCNFTSDLKSYYTTGGGSQVVPYEGFAYTEEGTVSLGRTWNSSNMHVAIINCTLDAGYSKTAYGTSGKNPRYTDMSGYAPNPEYLVEYKNEGDGAITANLDKTCSILSDEQAATYTIENIFAAENGGMTYSNNWNPSTEKTVTVTVVDSENKTVAKIYATDSITVSNLINAVNARLTDAEVGALYDADGNEITEAISESTTVYITTKGPDPAIKENLYYEYSDFAALTAGEDGTYSLDGITIDLGANGTFVSNNNDEKWFVLTGTTTFTLQMKAGTFIDWWAYQNETLTLKVNGTETEFTATDTTSECLYTYRATEDATIEIGVVESKTAYIKYIAVNMMFGEGTTDLVSGWPGANYTIQTLAYYKGIRVDASASGAKLALNGNGDWLQINAGTSITFSVPEGATATITFYETPTEGTDYTMTESNGLYTLTMLTDGKYIKEITVTIAV